MKWTTFTALATIFATTQSHAAFFNNRAAVQGYLKQGATALNDATGFPMRFIVKQNSTVVWCQDSASPVPVASGVFTSILSGSSNCSSLSNAFGPSVFNHAADTDAYSVSVVVDLSKDGFGGADDATFNGINLVSSPLAMVCNQANTALSATTATSATSATSATTATTAGNVSGIVAIANGGTGASSASAARTALGLGSLATISTSGVATDYLRGNGTWGVPVTALTSGYILVGNASNVAAGVAMSGDATITSAGVITVDKTSTGQANKIMSLNGSGISVSAGHQLNGSISGSASLQAAATTTPYSMTLPAAQGAANQVMANNGSGVLSWVTPVDTSSTQTVGGAKTFSAAASFGSGVTVTSGNLTMPTGSSITTSAGALTVTATTNMTVQSSSGNTTTVGNTGGAAATVIQAGTGKVKIGSAGTAITASGACSVSSTAVSTTAANVTCTGVPASTAIAVTCSPGAALSAAVAIHARATGTANQIALRATGSATAVTWTCMWVQP